MCMDSETERIICPFFLLELKTPAADPPCSVVHAAGRLKISKKLHMQLRPLSSDQVIRSRSRENRGGVGRLLELASSIYSIRAKNDRHLWTSGTDGTATKTLPKYPQPKSIRIRRIAFFSLGEPVFEIPPENHGRSYYIPPCACIVRRRAHRVCGERLLDAFNASQVQQYEAPQPVFVQ